MPARTITPSAIPTTSRRLAPPPSGQTVLRLAPKLLHVPISCPVVFCSRVSTCCCPLAPANHSASGLAINICDALVEEGGPRVEAKRRGGDPLPRASCRAKLRERAGSRVLAGVPRRESGGQPGTRKRHLRPTWANRLSRRRSGGERVVGRLLRQGDEVELVLDCEEGRTSIDHSEFSDFQGVRRRPQHAEVAGEDALTRREQDALTPHV